MQTAKLGMIPTTTDHTTSQCVDCNMNPLSHRSSVFMEQNLYLACWQLCFVHIGLIRLAHFRIWSLRAANFWCSSSNISGIFEQVNDSCLEGTCLPDNEIQEHKHTTEKENIQIHPGGSAALTAIELKL